MAAIKFKITLFVDITGTNPHYVMGIFICYNIIYNVYFYESHLIMEYCFPDYALTMYIFLYQCQHLLHLLYSFVYCREY